MTIDPKLHRLKIFCFIITVFIIILCSLWPLNFQGHLLFDLIFHNWKPYYISLVNLKSSQPKKGIIQRLHGLGCQGLVTFSNGQCLQPRRMPDNISMAHRWLLSCLSWLVSFSRRSIWGLINSRNASPKLRWRPCQRHTHKCT